MRGSNSNGESGEWSESNSFTTTSKKSNATTITSDENQYSDGLTIFSAFFNYYSAIIDKYGNEIWNSGDSNIVYYGNDGYGRLFASKYTPENDYNLPGLQFSIDNETIWMEPNDSFLHHDFFKLPNGNYMGLVEYHQNLLIPQKVMTDKIVSLHYYEFS